MAQRAGGEVDLPQLFSDVSRTISGLSSMMGTNVNAQADAPTVEGHENGGIMNMAAGLLTGRTCVKPCGMEDIQYAARAAGDMLITLKTCVLLSTVTFIICILLLTASAVYLVCKKSPPKRIPLPAFVRDVFPSRNESTKSDQSSQ